MKALCRDCKHRTNINNYYDSNTSVCKLTKNDGTYYDATISYYQSCSVININNDCKNYRTKWFTSFRTKIIMTFSIRLARDIFRKHFEKDEGFRTTYQANIAMLLHDRYGITDHKTRNRAANDIMKVIFDAEETDIKKKCHKPVVDRFEIMDL
jgi:hypothetical protein